MFDHEEKEGLSGMAVSWYASLGRKTKELWPVRSLSYEAGFSAWRQG